MRVRIPYRLISKFLDIEGLHKDVDTIENSGPAGQLYKVPGKMHYMVQMDLTDEPDLLDACTKWINVIETYFKTSYSAFRIDIGPYEGLWPTGVTIINNRNIVHFQLDDVDPNNGDWRDWFSKEDRIIAPK